MAKRGTKEERQLARRTARAERITIRAARKEERQLANTEREDARSLRRDERRSERSSFQTARFREEDAGFRATLADIKSQADAFELQFPAGSPRGRDTPFGKARRPISQGVNQLIEDINASSLKKRRKSGFSANEDMLTELSKISERLGIRPTIRQPKSERRAQTEADKDLRSAKQFKRDTSVANRNIKQRNQLAARRNLQTIPGAGSDLRRRTNSLLFPDKRRQGALV